MLSRLTISFALLLMMGGIAAAQETGGSLPFPESELTDQERREVPIRRFKKGALQKLAFELGTSTGGGLDLHHIETSIGTGIPLGSFDNILVVEPSFGVDFVDTRPDVDLPSELYDIGVNLFWRKPLNDRWSAMVLSSPSLRSDLTTTERGFRLFALGLLTYEWVPEKLSISGGAVALGRSDLPLLPAIGLKWTPTPRWRADINFPRPRISYRLLKDGSSSETWCYLAGGLGGQTWAITRDDGRPDEASIRELQLTCGVEQIRDGGGGLFAELGFAFGRRLEYEHRVQTVEFGNSLLVNGGWKW